MIRQMMNLECAKHKHRHFSAQPGKWIGKECLTIMEKKPNGNDVKCRSKLRRIK